jgi:hypothetical protein
MIQNNNQQPGVIFTPEVFHKSIFLISVPKNPVQLHLESVNVFQFSSNLTQADPCFLLSTDENNFNSLANKIPDVRDKNDILINLFPSYLDEKGVPNPFLIIKFTGESHQSWLFENRKYLQVEVKNCFLLDLGKHERWVQSFAQIGEQYLGLVTFNKDVIELLTRNDSIKRVENVNQLKLNFNNN